MAGLSFTWTLRHHGWAFCAIADDHGQAEAVASYVTGGPEYLLRAVTALAQGAPPPGLNSKPSQRPSGGSSSATVPMSRFASSGPPTAVRPTARALSYGPAITPSTPSPRPSWTALTRQRQNSAETTTALNGAARSRAAISRPSGAHGAR